MKKLLGVIILFICICGRVAAAGYNLEAIRLYNLGLEQYRVGAYSAAIDYFKSAVEIQNDFYDAYYNMAVVYDYLGNYSQAIMVLETVLRQKPEDAASLLKLAQIYYKKGDAPKALNLVDSIAPTSQEYTKARQLADRIKLENNAQAKYQGKEIAAKVAPTNKKIMGINSPSGITADINGQIYVASFSDNAIFKLKPNGIHQLYAKNSMINGPIGIAIDKNNNMYVANYNKNNILKIDKFGTTSVFVNYSNKPYYVFIRDNVLYVSEQGTNTIFTRTLD